MSAKSVERRRCGILPIFLFRVIINHTIGFTAKYKFSAIHTVSSHIKTILYHKNIGKALNKMENKSVLPHLLEIYGRLHCCFIRYSAKKCAWRYIFQRVSYGLRLVNLKIQNILFTLKKDGALRRLRASEAI